MAKLAGVVAPGLPHHVILRGNRCQQTFFKDEDYEAYRGLLADSCRRCGTQMLGYCLMPDHVHRINVPADEFGLREAPGKPIADTVVWSISTKVGEGIFGKSVSSHS